MTAKPKPPRTCPECVHDGGWHWTDDLEPRAYRCPQYLATEAQAAALKLTADAHTEAFKAAKQIIEDVARHVYEFDSNYIRDLFDEQDVPTPLRGAVFSWASSERASKNGPIIVAVGDVPSGEMPSGTRHRTYKWQSRIYRGSAA